MQDGLIAPIGSHSREVLTSGTGGINVVLCDEVKRMHLRESKRRMGGVQLGHVKCHTSCEGNETADRLCELGKGHGPYSQQKTWQTGTAVVAERRKLEGEGYPHAPVPGAYSCAWCTEQQRLAIDVPQANAMPPAGKARGKFKDGGSLTKAPSHAVQLSDYGSGVKLIEGISWTDKVVVGGRTKGRRKLLVPKRSPP